MYYIYIYHKNILFITCIRQYTLNVRKKENYLYFLENFAAMKKNFAKELDNLHLPGAENNFVNQSATVYFLKTVHLATFGLLDRQIVFLKRVYTEETVFMTPTVDLTPASYIV